MNIQLKHRGRIKGRSPEGPVTNVSKTGSAVLTRRSLVVALGGALAFLFLYQEHSLLEGFAGVALVLPVVLAASRVWVSRHSGLEYGLLRQPFQRELRAHLLQGANIWLLCGLMLGVLATGAANIFHGEFGFALSPMQYGVLLGALRAGIVMLAVLALVPARRVHISTNVVVALLSGFFALQLGRISVSPADPALLDSPLAGEWLVYNGGRSTLINGHPSDDANAIDFARLGSNGLTHSGARGEPLTTYPGFGEPVLAPADGTIIDVEDSFADQLPGTNSGSPNRLVVDIGSDRYVVLAHLKQGSSLVRVGDQVLRGQPLAAVGNNGQSSGPHLHMMVQDHPEGENQPGQRTYPMLFRNVQITRGGNWPWSDPGEVRRGDLIRPLAEKNQ